MYRRAIDELDRSFTVAYSRCTVLAGPLLGMTTILSEDRRTSQKASLGIQAVC